MNTDHEHSDQQTKQSRWGLRGKTAWDWLQLLVVPLMLALITVVFTWQQDARQQKIENQRAAAERELAKQRAQDEALQAYFDQMSTLMLENKLRSAEEDSEARTLARARTLTVLRRVDTSRRDEVIQFLEEARLVGKVAGREPVIGLAGASLSGTSLSFANLKDVDLSEADLSDANLSGAILLNADLSGANLRGAILFDADLLGANLSGANLNDANLSGAHLYDADLSGANLSGAYLDGATLSYANLSGAYLRGAEGMTNEELEQQADSLEGATMPNGQKYEDWRKERESRKEDGENDGSP